MDGKETLRHEKLAALADKILDKLSLRVDAEDGETMNPQAMKHITGIMKDLRDIQQTDRDSGCSITVTFDREWEDYSG